MIRQIPVTVECHSGYKADEYPKWFTLEGKRYEITGITDRWYQRENDPEYPASDYFKVETSPGQQHILKHDLENNGWFICR
jgi:hypothetical protein